MQMAVKSIFFSLACVLWLVALHGKQTAADFPEEIPFVPTPMEVVDKMLELAEVKKGDVVYALKMRSTPTSPLRRS
jgi:hypothetical protein